MNFYNEIDPHMAAWIRGLIAARMIPDGIVDERSITDIHPDELHEYTQVHFFCGLAGWPLALALAGWPADRRIWTGSCPCQPFSAAGAGRGTADERHLWPVFHRLIAACRPPVVIGEQVASAAVIGGASVKAQRNPGGTDVPVWLDGVFADLEGTSYACAAADLPAAGVGAPHIRQRLWWGALRLPDTQGGGFGEFGDEARPGSGGHVDSGGLPHGLAESNSYGSSTGVSRSNQRKEGFSGVPDHGGGERPLGMADHDGLHGDGAGSGAGDDRRELGVQERLRGVETLDGVADDLRHGHGGPEGTSTQQDGDGKDRRIPRGGDAWTEFRVIPCRDGKLRRIPVESDFQFVAYGLLARMGSDWTPFIESLPVEILSMFPLADPAAFKTKRRSARAPLLKGSGNAIVPQVGAAFIQCFMEAGGAA